ncbi:MAG: hypothetical protein Q9187_009136 [Circinaria calcarea]
MADRGGRPREVLHCHACENEWHKDENGLKCPQCESEAVEIVEQEHDPRHNHIENFFAPPSPPLQSLHDHNPWGEEAPDPDEGNIDHVEWHGPGMHFSRISYRSPLSSTGPQAQNPNDYLGNILGQFMAAAQPNFRHEIDRRGGSNRPNESRTGSGSNGYENTGLDRQGPRFPWMSPLQEGPGRQGNGRTFTARASARLQTPGPNGPQTREIQGDDFHRVLNLLMTSLGGAVVIEGPTPNGAPNPFTFLTQLLNPTNARHGDVVYTQEALDRVITQLMEQHNASSAPGPASPAAIAALPKTKIDESMLGSDGKAECSVCMDNVSVGDEVTMLPCKHWFHGDCVGAWLKEHDTCPHCRQSITPKDGDADTPRTPGQAPRHSSTPWEAGEGSGSRQNPFRLPRDPTREGGQVTTEVKVVGVEEEEEKVEVVMEVASRAG